MKLIGRFSELPKTEVLLFRTPILCIKTIIDDDETAEINVKEYKPRKYTIKRNGEEITLPVNKSLRHQIVIIKHIPYIMTIKIYSIPIDANEVKNIGLESIENVEKKERISESLYKLSGKSWPEIE